MNAPRETELKLTVTAADVARLRQRLRRFGRPRIERLETVYYDSAGFALAAQGIALRVRRAGRRWLQTLKTLGAQTALARRGEWETPAPGGRLDVARFAATPLATLLRVQPDLEIAPQVRTRFERALWFTADRAIEIALDRGEIVAGERSTPICELELELKAGDAAALWQLALELVGTGRSSKALALVPYADSKAARGVALAQGRGAQPVKANAKAFAGALKSCRTTAEALRAVIGTGTAILLANAHGAHRTSSGDDPEFIHQARVAVRRMRSAIRLLRDEADLPPRLDAELRWLGRALGAARDWDVFVLQTLPALAPNPREMHSAERHADELRAAAVRRRAQALRRARTVLAGARFARLALQLSRWAETPAPPSIALREFAPPAIGRALERVLRDADRFERLAPARQHRVRVRAKRLRYAIDVLAGALQREYADALGAHLASLQDTLGALNDLAVARDLLATLPARAARRQRAAMAKLRARRLRAAARELARLAKDSSPRDAAIAGAKME